MKIQRISWQNFKGLYDGEICCDGRDVVISGRNGVGKSSIASILPFVLFGKIDARGFDSKGLPVTTKTPTATIEFDTVTFKRSVVANKNRTFIDGREVTATEFNMRVLEMTKSAGTLLFNLFEFPSLHWSKQREFLLKHFAQNAKLPPVDEFKAELSQRKKEAQDLPGRIAELERQLSELPQDKVADVEEQLFLMNAELVNLQPQDVSRQEKFLREQLQTFTRRREELLQQYRSTRSTCPTCGQALPKAKVDEARNKIVVEGKKVAAKIESLRDEINALQSKQKIDIGNAIRMKELQSEINRAMQTLALLRNGVKLRERLAALKADEKSLNGRIAELEGKIAQAQQLQREQISASEQQVNEQFEFVRFKLFKLLANGDVRETCEAMIDGVPYSSLSKGEKLKAALDIMRTLQKRFNLEMPLFIDDAESYTANSFVEVPNQLFMFRVTDDELEISIDKARTAA